MTIFEKIDRARKLYDRCSKRLSESQELSLLLQRYRKEISNTQKMMFELDIVRDCAFCDANRPGGSCCGAGIEDWYDEILLLVNLLLECDIPENRRGRRDCLFLGEKGCRLMARNYFCVNYLCPRVWKRLTRQELARMQGQAGRELALSWTIADWLKEKVGEI